MKLGGFVLKLELYSIKIYFMKTILYELVKLNFKLTVLIVGFRNSTEVK